MDRKDKTEARARRKRRIRKKVFGTPDRPRMCVYKSLKAMYVQIVNDSDGKVITGASTLTKGVKAEVKYGGNVAAARKVGEFIGKKALEQGITQVVFDRNGFKYHGRIRALAEAAREAGLIF
jgi:large subunit ribosomal protein L18